MRDRDCHLYRTGIDSASPPCPFGFCIIWARSQQMISAKHLLMQGETVRSFGFVWSYQRDNYQLSHGSFSLEKGVRVTKSKKSPQNCHSLHCRHFPVPHRPEGHIPVREGIEEINSNCDLCLSQPLGATWLQRACVEHGRGKKKNLKSLPVKPRKFLFPDPKSGNQPDSGCGARLISQACAQLQHPLPNPPLSCGQPPGLAGRQKRGFGRMQKSWASIGLVVMN